MRDCIRTFFKRCRRTVPKFEKGCGIAMCKQHLYDHDCEKAADWESSGAALNTVGDLDGTEFQQIEERKHYVISDKSREQAFKGLE